MEMDEFTVNKTIAVLVDIREAERAYDWAKPKGGQQQRLMEALRQARFLLEDIEKVPNDRS
jgi:predicted DsbA family dithiol-disulfide isomerase